MKELLLKMITFAHVLFVIFVTTTPLTNSNYFLLLHAIVIPFLMVHWIFNDNTCVLTIIERKLRKEINKKNGVIDESVEDDCITCRLIEPIYDFKKNYKTFSSIIYFITISLWLTSVIKLVCKYKYGQILTWKDLFKI